MLAFFKNTLTLECIPGLILLLLQSSSSKALRTGALFRSNSGQHNDLAARFVLFHTAMRLNNLVKVEDLADLNLQCARGDLFYQFIEGCAHEVVGFTCIGRQTDRRRNRLHWGERVE
jgi:hypothetical protein